MISFFSVCMYPQVILSIGHHDNDPGAVIPGTTEHQEVKKIMAKAQDILFSQGIKVKVIPTNLTLGQKITWINQEGDENDFCLDIHLNAASNNEATGISTWYKDGDEKEKQVCEYFSSALSSRMNLRNRGALADTQNRHGSLGFVRNTIPHAWLFEMGFLTNPSDLDTFRKKGASALAECVIDLFLGGNPTISSENTWPFRDVPYDHFAFSAIKKAKELNIVKGYENNIFQPNSGITRGEMLIILERLGMF